jgi:hypothetical protein
MRRLAGSAFAAVRRVQQFPAPTHVAGFARVLAASHVVTASDARAPAMPLNPAFGFAMGAATVAAGVAYGTDVAECAGCDEDDEAAALRDPKKRRTAAGTSKKCPPVFNTHF